MRDVSKDPGITAKTVVSDFVVSQRCSPEPSTGMDCEVADQIKNPLLQMRHLQGRLKYAKDNLESPMTSCGVDHFVSFRKIK